MGNAAIPFRFFGYPQSFAHHTRLIFNEMVTFPHNPAKWFSKRKIEG